MELNGYDVHGLEDPITIYLPLPLSARAMNESEPVVWTWDCGTNLSLYKTNVNAMDFKRQAYCEEHYGEVAGDDEDDAADANMSSLVNVTLSTMSYSSHLWQKGMGGSARNASMPGMFVCDEINETYVPQCGRRSSGFLNFTPDAIKRGLYVLMTDFEVVVHEPPWRPWTSRGGWLSATART